MGLGVFFASVRRGWPATEGFMSAVMGDFLACLLKYVCRLPAHYLLHREGVRWRKSGFQVLSALLDKKLLSDGTTHVSETTAYVLLSITQTAVLAFSPPPMGRELIVSRSFI